MVFDVGFGMGFGATPQWYFCPIKLPLSIYQVNSLLADRSAPTATPKKQVANHDTM